MKKPPVRPEKMDQRGINIYLYETVEYLKDHVKDLEAENAKLRRDLINTTKTANAAHRNAALVDRKTRSLSEGHRVLSENVGRLYNRILRG